MLKDLKVIEFASVLAGPDVGMFFAELGAEVIKIENISGGDVTRSWKSSSENQTSKVSAYFSAVNWGKKYLSLDLKATDNRQTIITLIEEADIIITNFKPGSAHKLQLDYESIVKICPNIIYGEINGYGKSSKRSAYDVVLQAETGFMSINGNETSGPIKMPVALIDVLAAHQLKEGILLALLKREKTGIGSYVEVSLYDTAIASLKNQATNWLMNNTIAQPIGSLHPNIAPYGETFKTKDNFSIVLAIGNNEHFTLLLNILQAENLIADKKYSTNQKRVINRVDLSQSLLPLFKERTKDDLMSAFLKFNIPAGVINTLDKVFENKNAQNLILEETIDGVKTKRVKTAVFKIS